MNRHTGVLQPSRSVGDAELKHPTMMANVIPGVVTAEPELSSVDLRAVLEARKAQGGKSLRTAAAAAAASSKKSRSPRVASQSYTGGRTGGRGGSGARRTISDTAAAAGGSGGGNAGPLPTFLLLATDGVWDVFTSVGAATLVARALARSRSPEHAARVLVRAAVRKGSMDDVTACVAWFS